MGAYHSSPSKGPCSTRSHFVWEYKGKQIIKRKGLKNEETDIPFQVQFSSSTVFASYLSSEHVSVKRLNRVPAEDLSQVFNEPCHSCTAVTGVDVLKLRLTGLYHRLYLVN